MKIENEISHMHHKFLILDDVIWSFGSYNFTISAKERNWENMIRIEDKGSNLIDDFIKEFDYMYMFGSLFSHKLKHHTCEICEETIHDPFTHFSISLECCSVYFNSDDSEKDEEYLGKVHNSTNIKCQKENEDIFSSQDYVNSCYSCDTPVKNFLEVVYTKFYELGSRDYGYDETQETLDIFVQNALKKKLKDLKRFQDIFMMKVKF